MTWHGKSIASVDGQAWIAKRGREIAEARAVEQHCQCRKPALGGTYMRRQACRLCGLFLRDTR